jgi:hypothetical protein
MNTSAGNVVASIESTKKSKKGSKIASVAIDTGLKYLLTEPYLEKVP